MRRVFIGGITLLLCGVISARSKTKPLVFVFLRVDREQDVAIPRFRTTNAPAWHRPPMRSIGTRAQCDCRRSSRKGQRSHAGLWQQQICREDAGVFAARKMIRVVRETYETPESVAQRLERAGGRNRFGEANYRAVWGWNRLAWIGGKFEERDPATGHARRPARRICAAHPDGGRAYRARD